MSGTSQDLLSNALSLPELRRPKRFLWPHVVSALGGTILVLLGFIFVVVVDHLVWQLLLFLASNGRPGAGASRGEVELRCGSGISGRKI